jgi:hypothetical protein
MILTRGSYFVGMVPTRDNGQFVVEMNTDSLTDNTQKTKNRIDSRKQA